MEKTIEALIQSIEVLSTQYNHIEEIESEKTAIIIDRNGEKLEELVLQQEKLYTALDEAEDKRQSIAAMIADTLGIDQSALSVSSLTPHIHGAQLDRFEKAVTGLGRVMERVRRLTQINNRCLKDNMSFFNAVIDSLRQSVALDEGYSQQGSGRRHTSSALFNRTV